MTEQENIDNRWIDQVATCAGCGWPIEHIHGDPPSQWRHAGDGPVLPCEPEVAK